ncbi:hypothetical protein CB172_11025 [Salmonella enterica subsp. enterica serovar Claibornei]|nr:hypothetical protein [Salmonella enterica subsp. enterica serovar Claibornei]
MENGIFNGVRRGVVPLIVSILLVGMIPTQCLAESALPKGKDYPTAVYHGKTAASVDRSDEFTNLFRTRFKQALQNDVVFAGEYAQAEWGCGTSGCHAIAFINKRTGRDLARSFQAFYVGMDDDPQPIGEEILYMNKKSRLLVAYETTESSGSYYNYYLLTGSELKLIRKVPDKN